MKVYPLEHDYAVAPGLIIEEHLEARGMSPAELALRCGRSRKFISELIAGKAPITPKTALQLEKVLAVSADAWLGIDRKYQLHQARAAEIEEDEAAQEWVEEFPIKELLKRKIINPPPANKSMISIVLRFFEVATIDAWEAQYGAVNVGYRHSPTFENEPRVVATWLRLAEIYAEDQECEGYSADGFRSALKQIRHLTRHQISKSLNEAIRLCNDAGVALAFVEPLHGAPLSGAAWWHAPRHPIIALNARHKSNDRLWFNFFHEAAHILLHRKKLVFLDDDHRSDEDDLEAEANKWAENFLIPPPKWKAFTDMRQRYSQEDIEQFAGELGIAPGIIVGRLQHEKLLPRNSRLNNLKVKFTQHKPSVRSKP